MVSIKEVLLKVREGATVDALSKELGMRESTLRAMIDFMLERGYLEVIQGGSCAECSLRKKCNVPPPEERKAKMYVLTKEGREYIGDG